jgi:secreted trypsin-like serine protease
MKKLTIIVLLVLLLAVFVIPADAITWGEDDYDHEYVGAMIMDWGEWGKIPVCSGTLVHPRIFLAAGHCTDGVEPEEVWVSFEQDPGQQNPETYLDVEMVITHPNYYWGPTSNPHDVGILVLADEAGVEPASLPTEGYLDQLRASGLLRKGSEKGKFTVVGYGGSLDWPPPEVYYEDVRQAAQSEFRALLKAWLRLSQNPAAGDAGTCYGDSGGPAFFSDETIGEVLVGITSWGDVPCISAGFNYRVDIPETLEFIEGVFAELN